MIKYTLPEYSPLPPLPMESQVFSVERENLRHNNSFTKESPVGTIRDICLWFLKYREYLNDGEHRLHLKPYKDGPSSYIYTPSQLDVICAQLGLTK